MMRGNVVYFCATKSRCIDNRFFYALKVKRYIVIRTRTKIVLDFFTNLKIRF